MSFFLIKRKKPDITKYAQKDSNIQIQLFIMEAEL